MGTGNPHQDSSIVQMQTSAFSKVKRALPTTFSCFLSVAAQITLRYE